MGFFVFVVYRDCVVVFVECVRGISDIVIGGEVDSGFGFFYWLIVVVNVDGDVEIVWQEVFGLVVIILWFFDLDEVLVFVNVGFYGLVLLVWIKDVGFVMWMLLKFRYGFIWVNMYGVVMFEMFWVVMKGFGMGCDMLVYVLDVYMLICYVMVVY